MLAKLRHAPIVVMQTRTAGCCHMDRIWASRTTRTLRRSRRRRTRAPEVAPHPTGMSTVDTAVKVVVGLAQGRQLPGSLGGDEPVRVPAVEAGPHERLVAVGAGTPRSPRRSRDRHPPAQEGPSLTDGHRPNHGDTDRSSRDPSRRTARPGIQPRDDGAVIVHPVYREAGWHLPSRRSRPGRVPEPGRPGRSAPSRSCVTA
jgi:hypothetical protein